jgi:Ion channel
MMTPAQMRKRFFTELLKGIKVVWPILSVLVGAMAATGFVVCELEGWPKGDGIYFAFVSGLTIGYGDLVPRHPVSRLLSVMIGFAGILLIGLVSAVGMHALDQAWQRHAGSGRAPENPD